MEFVAIDFETANGNANSACQLAAVHVENSQIVKEQCWLIRPPRMYFAPRNTAIHGIRAQQVVQAPSMEQVWEILQDTVRSSVLMAHNARFDVNVLIASLAAYDLACPPFEFSCTRSLARAGWPGRSRYGLKPLGEALGIQFRHHDALEDARCCAQIALAVARDHAAQSLPELERALQVKRGSYRDGQISSPRTVGRGRRQAQSSGRQHTDRWGFPSSQPARLPARVDPGSIRSASAGGRPLASKRIVMLGPLRGLSLEETQQLIQDLGGTCQSQIGSSTDYVVACGTSLDSASTLICQQLAEHASDEKNRAEATGIRLLSERQFRALLPGGKAARW